MSTIAFFGLGNMGAPMATNLIQAGHQLQLFDPMPEALTTFENTTAIATHSPIDAVNGVDIVISMLPSGHHVTQLYLGGNDSDGILAHLHPNTLIIDCSTIDVGTVQNVYQQATKFGLKMLDAPVSGGVSAANNGTLSFMCGADQNTFESAATVLKSMGKNIFRAGNIGAGQIAKMCNNMLLAIQMTGTSEALQLGINNGLDPSVLSEIMAASSGANWCLDKYNPAPGVMPNAPASHDYAPGFTVDLMLKDLGLAMENSILSKSAVPMGALARNLYVGLKKQKNGTAGSHDFSSIWRIY